MTTAPEPYRALAQALDAIPNGFPATESGIELELLAKMFTPEEAALAAAMRLARESAADIARRANVEDSKAAYRTLRSMARKGLIIAGRGEGRELFFELMPFVVGIYEEQLPHLDEGMAALFERYFQEAQGFGTFGDVSSVHRVIPVETAISFDLGIYPYEHASALLEDAKAWGVRDCICRVQKQLVGDGCEHEIENCLVFAPIENIFDNSKTIRALSKEEALQILRESEEAGLVHTTGNYRDEHFYICNCCTCSCGILRGIAEFDIPTAVAHSDFRATVDAELCAACEMCIERCQFGALSISDDGVCVVDRVRCVGCGVCVMACTTGALALVRRPEGERVPLPADIAAWRVQRAKERGIEWEEAG